MATAASVDSGQLHKAIQGFSGPGVGTGSFQVAANTSSNTVTDVNVPASGNIVCAPSNATASLLARKASLFVATGNSAGSFVFTSSATASVAPAGTETFTYFYGLENA